MLTNTAVALIDLELVTSYILNAYYLYVFPVNFTN